MKKPLFLRLSVCFLFTCMPFFGTWAVLQSKCEEAINGIGGPKGTKALTQNSQLIARAKNLVNYQELLFDETFKSTHFTSFEEFQGELLNRKDEFEDATKLIMEGGVEITRIVKNKRRQSLVHSGFLSRYERSNFDSQDGFSDYDAALEASMLGKTLESYKNVANQVGPKYAYVSLKPDSEQTQFLEEYGDDIYIFDLNKIKDRLTWTPGDSFVRFASYTQGGGQLNTSRRSVKQVNSWDLLFIPWSRREIIIPLINPRFKETQRIEPTLEDPLAIKLNPQIQWDSYAFVEAQIWGPLDLSMVKQFIFTKSEPTGEFLDALKKNGIQILDGRFGKPYKNWKEDLTTP